MSAEHESEAELRERLLAAAAVLEEVVASHALLAVLSKEEHQRLLGAAGRISRASRMERKALQRALARRRKAAKRAEDEALLNQTAIRKKRSASFFETPSHEAPEEAEEFVNTDEPQLHNERRCYVCKTGFRALHPFYDAMCKTCGDENLRYRNLTADLSGRTALITGARVKIGYQAAIKLLRAGARVIVTTRFPNDAARRYSDEEDFAEWQDRLRIYGLDLRHTPSVEQFCRDLSESEPRLDFIINNACQTVRRPSGFYGHLMAGERASDHLVPAARQLVARPELPEALVRSAAVDSAEASQVALLPEDLDTSVRLFPEGALDKDQQQVDLREMNSWRLMLDEVSSVELLEVQLVNAVAPFVLNGRLRPLMMRTDNRDKHIVNVSAMEGQFYRS